MRQILETDNIHPDSAGARFYAVIIDPDTGKRIKEVPIFDLRRGAWVELAIDRETLFPMSDDNG